MLSKIDRRMTPEEFHAWQEGEDEKYELVGGYPVLRCPDLEMMTGASRRHDQIVWNILAELKVQLRGGPCRGFTSDTAVKTTTGNRRRPDAGVECGKRDDKAHDAGDVRMVAEVLSPSTHELDMFGKLDEYRAIPTMHYVLLIEPNAPRAILWARGDNMSWDHVVVEGLDSSVELPSVGVSLKFRDIYDEIDFDSVPHLVDGSGA